MMNEREVFLAAIEIPDMQERAAWVKQACGDDQTLHLNVEKLLAAHQSEASLFEQPAIGQSAVQITVLSTSELSEQNKTPMNSLESIAHVLQPTTRSGWLGRLAHYEIEAVLGAGAFGTVVKAFDEKLHRVVAIKILNPTLAATSPPRKRFLREARSSAAVRHENIVGIHAVEEEPIPYLVMEYIPGLTLQQRLEEHGPLDISETLEIGKQIALGLAAAHAQGLIHRDIKPANVLLETSPQYRVKITDFGLARAVDDASLTQSGLIAGTPMFMSPQQARGESLDHRTDLFSLGSVLYQVLAGHPAFRASSTVAVLRRVCEDTPRPIRELIPETPQWLCDIVSQMMEKDANARFQSAREIADLFARCQSELQQHKEISFRRESTHLAPQDAQSSHLAPRDERSTSARSADSRSSADQPTVITDSKSPAAATASSSRQSGNEAAKRWLFWPGLITTLAVIAVLVFNSFQKPAPPSGSRQSTGSTDTVVQSQPDKASQSPSGISNSKSEISKSVSAGWHGWPADAPPPAIAPFDAEQAKRHQEEWAAYLKVPVEFTNSIGMKFRLIPPGEFMFGCTKEEADAAFAVLHPDFQKSDQLSGVFESQHPQAKVVLTHPFYLSVTEVQQGAFRALMGTNPSYHSAVGDGKDRISGRNPDRMPVENLSWDSAATFTQRLSQKEGLSPQIQRDGEILTFTDGSGYTLPSEFEWEFACRAGSINQFTVGDTADKLGTVAWTFDTAGYNMHESGRLAANAFGLHDMLGNASEFTRSAFEDMRQTLVESICIDPHGPEFAGRSAVVRGGSWDDGWPYCRAAHRSPFNPHHSGTYKTGIRVSLSVEGAKSVIEMQNQSLMTQATNGTELPQNKLLADPAFKPEAFTYSPGQPLGAAALVQRPAAIAGVQSWTIGTRHFRGAPSGILSPGGQWMAVWGQDQEIRILNAHDFSLKHTIMASSIPPILNVEWSTDASLLLVHSGLDIHCRTEVFASRTGQRVFQSDLGKGSPYAHSPRAAFAPNGLQFAVPIGRIGGIEVVDLLNGQKTTAACKRDMDPFCWTSDSSSIIAGSGIPDLLLERFVEGKLILSAAHDFGNLSDLVPSPDGQFLALTNLAGRTVELRKMADLSVLWKKSTRLQTAKLVWSPDSKQLLAWDYSSHVHGFGQACAGRAWLLDAVTGEEIKEFGTKDFGQGNTTWVSGAAWPSFIGVPFDSARRPLNTLRYYKDLSTPDQYEEIEGVFAAHGNASWKTADRQIPVVPVSLNRGRFDFSDDRKAFAEVGINGEAFVWDAAHGQVRFRLKHPSNVILIDVNHDGSAVATTDEAGQVRVWALPELGTLPNVTEIADVPELPTMNAKTIGIANGPRTAIAFAPDGKTLAASIATGLEIWNLTTGMIADAYDIPVGAPGIALCWQPDGKTLLARCIDGRLAVIDVTRAEIIRTIPNVAADGVFLEDGQLYAWRDPSGATCIADASTGFVEKVVHLDHQRWFAVNSEGHFKATPGVEEELVCIVQTTEGQQTLGISDFATKYGWKNDPSRVRISGEVAPLTPIPPALPNDPGSLTISTSPEVVRPTTELLQSLAGKPLSPNAIVETPPSIDGVASWSIEPVGLGGFNWTPQVSSDERLLLESDFEGYGAIIIRDAQTLVVRNMLVPPTGFSCSSLWLNDSQFVFGDRAGHVCVWNSETGTEEHRFLSHLQAGPPTLVFSAGGRLVATQCDWFYRSGVVDDSMRIWDRRSGALLQVHELNQIHATMPSPDDEYLAVAQSGLVYIVEVRTRRVVSSIPLLPNHHPMILWLADSRRLAIVSGTRTVQVWSMESGRIESETPPVSGSSTIRLSQNAPNDVLAVNCESCNDIWVFDCNRKQLLPSLQKSDGTLIGGPVWYDRGKSVLIGDRRGGFSKWIKNKAEPVQRISGRLASDWPAIIWDPSGTQPVGTGGFLVQAPTTMHRFPFSPDGQHCVKHVESDGIRIDRIADSKNLWSSTGTGALISDWSWSPDGSRIAVVTRGEAKCYIFNVEDQKLLHSIPFEPGELAGLEWIEDDLLAAINNHRTVVVFHASGENTNRWDLKEEAFFLAASIRGDRKLCVVVKASDFEVRDLSTGEVVRTMPYLYYQDDSRKAGWLPDGRHLAIKCRDRQLRVVNAVSGEIVRLMPIRDNGGVFTPSGLYIGFVSHSQRCVHDLTTGEHYSLLYLRDNHWIKITPEGHYSGSEGVEELIRYVAQTAEGQQTLTAAEFAVKYHWKNDPSRVP